jgi:hypothetical protein
MVLADPLAPAIQLEAALQLLFLAGKIRAADEDQMSLKSHGGQKVSQVRNAHTQTACLRVWIGSFEGQEYEFNLIR